MAVSAPTSTTSDVNVTSTPAASSAADATVTADRFLKLLVAQMQNQDPLNPMDNAQVTSQMAQINTVTGIDKLNTTVQGLSSQFMQLQAVQGASLVGHDVIVAGNKLSIDDDRRDRPGRLRARRRRRRGQGRDPVARAARSCRRSTSAPRAPACTASTGPRARRPTASGLTFRVSATTGGVATTATALMRDRVDAVSTNGTTFNLELAELGHRALQLGQGLQLTAPSRFPAASAATF